MRKLPYGVSNFESIRTKGDYFVDKTRYIKNIEDNANFLFFFRPRRFGKSLLCSILECYYDIKRKDMFESLFGGLWIGENPTEERNQYMVLRFDFSLVTKDIDKVQDSFNQYVSNRINNFIKYYSEYFDEKDMSFILSLDRPSEKMIAISECCKALSIPFYLIIDEYDNFTNAILFNKSNRDDYEKITHGTGFYRDFFQVCKPSFDRIFMTGVSPVTYDDLTSGFNIGTNITMSPNFNGMLGFTESEVRTMVDYFRENGIVTETTDEIIDLVKPWYDNCCFAEESYGEESVYNSDAVLFFMNEYKSKKGVPKDMVDPNTKTDYQKLKMLVFAGNDNEIDDRKDILEQIVTDGEIVADVVGMFPAETIGNQKSFLSMLFYYGVLTFGGFSEYGESILKITNKVMRTQYLEYMMEMIADMGVNPQRQILDTGLRDAAFKGEWENLIDHIGKIYHEATTVRCSQIAERYAQAFFHGMIYLNPYYCVKPEVEADHGFCDLFLFPEPTARLKARYTYIIELKFKHSKKKSKNASDKKTETVDSLVKDAERQLKKYASDKSITAMSNGLPLKLLYVVVDESKMLKAGEVKME